MKGPGDKGSEKQDQDKGKNKGDKNEQRLSDMTKKELYEKAKELDVPGRSRMNKDELKKHLE